MDPNIGLHAASGLVSFLLKSTLEWGICLLLVRIAGSAKARFNLLLAMLTVFLAQWGVIAFGTLRTLIFHSAANALPATSLPQTAERIAVAAPDVSRVSYVMLGLLAIYATGLSWRLLGTLVSRFRLMRAMRHRIAPSSQMENIFQEIVSQAGLRKCALWVLPGITSPATLGWIRPRVIVPPVCEEQDETELKAVFWHELKHIERRDAMWNAVIRASQNLLWFHPAVHHAARALQAQRELACDAAVVHDHPQSRDVYASCLLRFARVGVLTTTIEMASGAELLKTRVRTILSETPQASLWVRGLRVTANMGLLGLMIATVPALNILFAAPVRIPLAAVPLAVVSSPSLHLRARAHTDRASSPRPAAVAAVSASKPVYEEASAAPMVHDEALAAEHRAGAGVLMESSGMDSEMAHPKAAGNVASGTPGHPSGMPNSNSTSTWSSVAISAAQQMVPLMGDHDSDRH